jgi:RES domain-containing protein
MNGTLRHDHVPIYRVVRRSWVNPIDTSFSQRPGTNNRWNTTDFPALYCCCSEAVARSIVRDIFRITGSSLADLLETAYPQLVEIQWEGEPVDMTGESAILLAGFSPKYPNGVDHSQTQSVAISWHSARASGVLCRSASMAHLGFTGWSGDHAAWSELAIYTENCPTGPIVLNRRDDLDWLSF